MMDTNSLTCQADSPPHNPSTEQSTPNNEAIHRAIVCAVHETDNSSKILYAVLAPKHALEDVRVNWGVTPKLIRKFDKFLRSEEPVYICVPLSEDNDYDHLPLKDFTLRYIRSLAILHVHLSFYSSV